MVFLQPGVHLSDTEELEDVSFNVSSIDNRVDERDVHTSSIVSRNDNHSVGRSICVFYI